jgi:predicted NBD/HSP70 family sugar kinase
MASRSILEPAAVRPSIGALTGTGRVSAREMRQSNLGHILAVLRSSGQISRTELARATGLTIPTVHRLIAELAELGLVQEDETPRRVHGSGRRPIWYRFKATAATVAAVDVGNETTRGILTLADGTVVDHQSVPTDHIAHRLPEEIASIIRHLQRRDLTLGPLVGMSVGISAAIDPATGAVSRAPIYHEWEGLPIQELLEAALDCRVFVEQDDHLAALAELSERGAAPHADSVVVVNLGKGIGAGSVVDGVVVRGRHGAAGRVARWPLSLVGQDRDGDIGDVLVADAMVRAYKDHGGSATVQDGLSLCQAARSGDPAARTVITGAADVLAGVFLMLATSFDPEVMVLGGGFAGSFDLFEPALDRALAALPHPPLLVATQLGDKAVVQGGLIVALRNLDSWLQEKLLTA